MSGRHHGRRAMRCVIGTSGWQYGDWRGRFYPAGLAQSRWLAHYATRFPTVEVNSTFYRLPDRRVFASWREGAPDGFCFALKLSRYLSHVKRLGAPAEPVRRFISRAEALGDAWGPTLLQLPPTMGVDPARLSRFLERWPADRRLAVEFRHPSWFCDEVRALLGAHDAALVLADRRGRRLQPLWRTAGWTYVRFHQGTRNHPHYRGATLRRWLDDLHAQWDGDEDVYVYFNNDQQGAAVRDAVHFAALSGTALPGGSDPAPARAGAAGAGTAGAS